MAKKHTIDIDGYIGDWYNSKRFVKNILKNHSESAVICRVNSLGGSVDDAIDIAAQFETHGEVTCELFSLNASAATVLTLGAKHVRMHKNAMYLIHKALSWVDAWGYMNEDQMEETIADIKKWKDQNAAITLVLAKMYAKKSGKLVTDILNLMKKEKWLSAEEAKTWGFVDEIFTDTTGGKSTEPTNEEMTQLLNVVGLPIPQAFINDTPPSQPIDSKNIVSDILYGIKEIFNPQNKTVIEMNKTFVTINALLNVDGIESKNGKVELTEDQLKVLNDAIDTANAGKKTAEDSLTEKETKHQTEIDALNVKIKELEKGPGAETNQVPKPADGAPANNSDEMDIAGVRNLYNILP